MTLVPPEKMHNSVEILSWLLRQVAPDQQAAILAQTQKVHRLLCISARSNATAFGPDQLVRLAIQSLTVSDRELAVKNSCDRSVISKARARYTSSLVYVLVQRDLCEEFNLTSEALEYYNRITRVMEERLMFRVAGILEDVGINLPPCIHRLLCSYASDGTIYDLFKEKGIELEHRTTIKYDSAIRAFVLGKRDRGFQTVAKRSIAATMLQPDTTNGYFKLAQAVMMLNELGIDYKQVRTSSYANKVIRFFREQTDRLENIFQQIADGHPASRVVNSGFHHTITSAALRFAFSVMLQPPHRDIDTELILEILQTTPSNILKKIQSTTLNGGYHEG